MKPNLTLTVCMLLFVTICQSQSPAEQLGTLVLKSPIEKAHLHFDRENYIAGETAWFKAYLYSEYQPDTISTSLFVELVGPNGSVMQRAVLPVLLGTANGYLQIPDSLPSGSYLVRSYSPTMLNMDNEFVGRQHINIYGKKGNAPNVQSGSVRMEFFPEGGQMVQGISGTIAFKASFQNGLPAAVKGKIINSKSETLTEFTSYHDGLGMFDLNALTGEKYYAVLDQDRSGQKYELPTAVAKGIVVTIIPHPEGNFFEIKQSMNDPVFQAAYMVGQMQHHVVFKQEFKIPKAEIQGVINTQKLPSGILHVSFFNKDNQPLAERLCFVDNKEYRLKGELNTDTLNLKPKGRNVFSLQLADTVRGSFSVSVTDGVYDIPDRAANIYSSLLLTGDLKGYIHRPAYYFSGDNDSIRTALDLVMMTNGWRRFKWTAINQAVMQRPAYKDQSYITLSGKINLRDSKKPFANKQALVMLITADSVARTQMITTDQQGNFKLDSMLFFGRSKLVFSDIRGKKNEYIDVSLTGDSLIRKYSVANSSSAYFTGANNFTNPSLLENDYDALLKAKGITLEGVTIKTKKKNPLLELEEKYASGMFSGAGASKTIDLVNSKEAMPYLNIFDYIRDRVNGVQVFMDGPDYQLYYRQSGTVSSLGIPPMILYLDEVETAPAVIASIPANQIAMVKVFPTLAGAAGNATGGAMAIYTKKDADMNDIMQKAADVILYDGYTVIKEFYAPDYNVEMTSVVDNRITIDWRPSILVNNVNPRIPFSFYNSDRTKSFRVVIEGMTTDGKMLSIDKIVSPR